MPHTQRANAQERSTELVINSLPRYNRLNFQILRPVYRPIGRVKQEDDWTFVSSDCRLEPGALTNLPKCLHTHFPMWAGWPHHHNYHAKCLIMRHSDNERFSLVAGLASDRLSDNPSKTEYLIIGTHQQRAKLVTPLISFQGTILTSILIQPATSESSLTRAFLLKITFLPSAKHHTTIFAKFDKYDHHLTWIYEGRSKSLDHLLNI